MVESRLVMPYMIHIKQLQNKISAAFSACDVLQYSGHGSEPAVKLYKSLMEISEMQDIIWQWNKSLTNLLMFSVYKSTYI